jgi:hypothetical protein
MNNDNEINASLFFYFSIFLNQYAFFPKSKIIKAI